MAPMIDPDLMLLLRDAGPVAVGVAVAVIAWAELRLRPPLLRAIASHAAVVRRLGVSEQDVADELERLKKAAASRG